MPGLKSSVKKTLKKVPSNKPISTHQRILQLEFSVAQLQKSMEAMVNHFNGAVKELGDSINSLGETVKITVMAVGQDNWNAQMRSLEADRMAEELVKDKVLIEKNIALGNVVDYTDPLPDLRGVDPADESQGTYVVLLDTLDKDGESIHGGARYHQLQLTPPALQEALAGKTVGDIIDLPNTNKGFEEANVVLDIKQARILACYFELPPEQRQAIQDAKKDVAETINSDTVSE